MRFLQFKQTLSELIVCLRISGIYLDGINELDFGLTILSLFEVALAGVKVLLLADVRISGTRRKNEGNDQKQEHDQTLARRKRHTETSEVGVRWPTVRFTAL